MGSFWKIGVVLGNCGFIFQKFWVTFEKTGGSLRAFDVIMPKYKIQIYIYGFLYSGAIEIRDKRSSRD